MGMSKHPTKIIKIYIQGQPYLCRAGVVPHLDMALLIGCDCPILSQLVEDQGNYTKPPEQIMSTTSAQAEEVKAPPLPMSPGEMARLTAADPILMHARAAASQAHPSSQAGPYFTWKHLLLYNMMSKRPSWSFHNH